MSEKKAKSSYVSKGARRSGGRVVAVNLNALQHALLNPPEAKFANVRRKTAAHTLKALALVRRAGAHI